MEMEDLSSSFLFFFFFFIFEEREDWRIEQKGEWLKMYARETLMLPLDNRIEFGAQTVSVAINFTILLRNFFRGLDRDVYFFQDTSCDMNRIPAGVKSFVF